MQWTGELIWTQDSGFGSIARMSRIPPELEAEMTPAVKAYVLTLHDMIDALTKKVEDLTEQVKRLTPRNSSLPPSSQHPHAKPKPRPKPGKRKKQGGQEGHKRHLRDLIPSQQCTSVSKSFPKACRRCGGELAIDRSNPQRHQVWDLPEIKPLVAEYQLYRGHCACCGITTQAELPAGVPKGQYGPRLAAFTGLLMGHFRQSKRRAAMFLSDLLNIPCCPAWMVKIQNSVSQSLADSYEGLRRQLCKQRQLFVDESPTKQKRERAWTWVATTGKLAVFKIITSRSRQAFASFVGDYANIILNCDRAKMYLDANRLQWCWSHLTRDIQRLIDSSNSQIKRLGYDLMRQQRLLFEQWHRYKRREISWPQLKRVTRPIRDEFNGLLLRGKYSGNAKLKGICKGLLHYRKHLWTFLETEGLEPTNNTAERALRPSVIHRKLSFGTQSCAGSRFLERILTVSETCRLQARSAYDYLIAAVKAKFTGQSAPSLLPISTKVTLAAA